VIWRFDFVMRFAGCIYCISANPLVTFSRMLVTTARRSPLSMNLVACVQQSLQQSQQFQRQFQQPTLQQQSQQ
jgi:hypothetical protein